MRQINERVAHRPTPIQSAVEFISCIGYEPIRENRNQICRALAEIVDSRPVLLRGFFCGPACQARAATRRTVAMVFLRL